MKQNFKADMEKSGKHGIRMREDQKEEGLKQDKGLDLQILEVKVQDIILKGIIFPHLVVKEVAI